MSIPAELKTIRERVEGAFSDEEACLMVQEVTPRLLDAVEKVLAVADEPAPVWFTADQSYTYDAAMDHVRDAITTALEGKS